MATRLVLYHLDCAWATSEQGLATGSRFRMHFQQRQVSVHYFSFMKILLALRTDSSRTEDSIQQLVNGATHEVGRWSLSIQIVDVYFILRLRVPILVLKPTLLGGRWVVLDCVECALILCACAD